MRSLTIVRAIVLATMLLLTTSLAAAQFPTLNDGDRIRVRTSNPSTFSVGLLLGRTADSIRISGIPGRSEIVAQRAIAVADIVSLDQHSGRSHNGEIGAVLGLFVGIAVSQSVRGDTSGHGLGDAIAAKFTKFVGCAAIGTIVGAIVGHSIETDTWRRVALDRPATPRARVQPTLSGHRVGLSIAF